MPQDLLRACIGIDPCFDSCALCGDSRGEPRSRLVGSARSEPSPTTRKALTSVMPWAFPATGMFSVLYKSKRGYPINTVARSNMIMISTIDEVPEVPRGAATGVRIAKRIYEVQTDASPRR